MTDIVEYAEQDTHVLIRMDDGKANALGFELLSQLSAALDRAEAAGKVVVILGREGKFSAGFDLSVMGSGGDAMIDLLRAGADLSRRVLNFPFPVVLAVSGHALAMGGLLLLSADYRIGLQGNFKIGLNEVAIGMTLPWFGIELAKARLAPTYLEQAVGLATIYDPVEATAAGYLDEAVPADEFLPRVEAVAARLSTLNMEAHRNSKARTRELLNKALDEALVREFPA